MANINTTTNTTNATSNTSASTSNMGNAGTANAAGKSSHDGGTSDAKSKATATPNATGKATSGTHSSDSTLVASKDVKSFTLTPPMVDVRGWTVISSTGSNGRDRRPDHARQPRPEAALPRGDAERPQGAHAAPDWSGDARS